MFSSTSSNCKRTSWNHDWYKAIYYILYILYTCIMHFVCLMSHIFIFLLFVIQVNQAHISYSDSLTYFILFGRFFKSTYFSLFSLKLYSICKHPARHFIKLIILDLTVASDEHISEQIALQSLVKSMPVGHCLSWGCHNCVDCRIELTFDPVTPATTRHLCSYHRCVCSSSTWAEFPARAAAGWRTRSPRWGRCSPAPEPASPCPDAWWSPPGATERSEGMWRS